MLFFSPRMGLTVILLQLTVGNVGVYLCGGERRVSEQLLHGIQVGAIVEHIGGKRVAEHMRAQAGGMHGAFHCLVNHVIYQLPVKRSAVGSHEKFTCGRESGGGVA